MTYFSNIGLRAILWSTVLVYFFQSYYFPIVDENFGLYYITHPNFEIYQLLTYSFLHFDAVHLIVNLLVLTIVGVQLERDIKTIPFLVLNLITAIVAGLFQMIANMISVYLIFGTFNPFDLSNINPVKKLEILFEHGPWLYSMLNSVTIGASGCVFGVLTAFAYLYPRNKIKFFSEVQVSTRFIIICYFILQVYNGITLSQNGIAHFAHLGGVVSGLITAIYFKKKYHLKFEV